MQREAYWVEDASRPLLGVVAFVVRGPAGFALELPSRVLAEKDAARRNARVARERRWAAFVAERRARGLGTPHIGNDVDRARFLAWCDGRAVAS